MVKFSFVVIFLSNRNLYFTLKYIIAKAKTKIIKTIFNFIFDFKKESTIFESSKFVSALRYDFVLFPTLLSKYLFSSLSS